jgi:outer membrane protein assembly factor BamB
MKLLCVLVLINGIMGCNEKCIPEPDGIVSNEMSAIVDKIPFENSSLPIVYQNLLLVGEDASTGYLVYALDKNTLDTVWMKTDFPSTQFNPVREDGFMLYDNKLVLSENRYIVVLDANSGEELWQAHLEDGWHSGQVLDDWIYKADYSKQKETLFRFDLFTGAREKVLELGLVDGYSPGIMMPVKWTSPVGDEILVLQNRTFNWAGVGQQEPADADRMDILGYNLTADTMLWYRKGLAKISSNAAPAIDGNKVYFYGGSKVHCIDPANGEDIWEFQVGGSNSLEFVGSNILLHNDMLIAKPASRAMYALDKETGQQIWYNPATMSSPSAMTIESDTVYFTGYYLNGVDVNTGELVVQYESPESRSFFHGVGINPDNGYVYASDGKYLYCLDPKKMKKP